MKPGRNDPCVCGSGKKYKKCCQGKLEARPAVQPLRQKVETATPEYFIKGSAPTPAECEQLVALFKGGYHAELESRARLLLERYPDSGYVWKALGLTLRMRGKDSLQALQKAAEFLQGDTEVHFNLGSTLYDLGRLDEAESSYRRALRIEPDYAEAHFSLALLFYAQGKFMPALNSVIQSLKIKEVPANKSLFVACVKHMQFGSGAAFVRNNLVRALSEPWGRPCELAEACAMLVKLNPIIEECVIRAIRSWPQRLMPRDLIESGGLAAASSDPLLRTLIGATAVCDIELERFLTTCRQALLDAASAQKPSGAGDENIDENILGFYSALARQCFINEYVFAQTGNELLKASALRDSLVAALEAKAPVPAIWPVAVAAYFPLYSLPHASRFLDGQWPEAVSAVLVQQVREPEQELQERAGIPRLTDIEDEVSLLVQNQYEENPYPRWISMAPPGNAMTIDAKLRQLFPLVSFRPVGNCPAPEILVAGCGTGQHSIGAAQKFQGGRVLAVDLSMSSLSYAKRKTREMGLTSIEYAQADIMKLGSLDRSFDVIESCGVLHHLADPWAGWRILLSLLRPGGFMRLGFYSEVARRNIVRTRAFIAEQGYGSTAEEIRRCRQDMMASDETAGFGRMFQITDFFSTSECRDLLFHVQEHRMTLTGIESFLRDNDLAFLGFEINANFLRAYKRRFPDDRTATNLAQWQTFENENPDTFIGMYNFWVQKAA
jgi:SAM-dependent methyltransferase/tetratricopeptide (TPR) repeat protein